MSDSPNVRFPSERKKAHLEYYLTREPVFLAVLFGVAVVCFGAVSGLSGMYHSQRNSLGTEWSARGAEDLQQKRYDRAVVEFRTALVYSRDNYSYQLDLAEALLGQKKTEEAAAYLVNLWDREPENGLVNLELARISAQLGEADQALRYYHNAVYATWPGDRQEARQQARLELIDYLLKIGDKQQAQSELIALAANLDNDPARQAHLGDLFVKAGDYSDALAAYLLGLKTSRKDPLALEGAGHTAFQLGRYRQAHQYLQAAVAAGAHDPQVEDELKITQLVLRMDPFRSQISASERDRDVIEAFDAAKERLDSCAAANPASMPAAEQNLSESWTKLKPQINARGLRQNSDLALNAMELVFEIERQTSAPCGHPNPTDRALLLIARLHEGN